MQTQERGNDYLLDDSCLQITLPNIVTNTQRRMIYSPLKIIFDFYDDSEENFIESEEIDTALFGNESYWSYESNGEPDHTFMEQLLNRKLQLHFKFLTFTDAIFYEVSYETSHTLSNVSNEIKTGIIFTKNSSRVSGISIGRVDINIALPSFTIDYNGDASFTSWSGAGVFNVW